MEKLFLLLPVLACPVGMGLMMWFMAKGTRGEDRGAEKSEQRSPSLEVLREEHDRLGAQIERLETTEADTEREPAGR